MSNNVLFSIPLKHGCLEQYETFAKEIIKHADDCREMFSRYDIKLAKVWHKYFSGRDYVFVYHEVGPKYKEKMASWNNSAHPFDTWFRENMMAVYDIENIEGMEMPRLIVDLT